MQHGGVQISDVEALDIDRVLQAILNGSRLSSVASLQLLVRLLHGVRPDWMSSFPAFRRWQAHTMMLLSQILHWSTTAHRLSQVTPRIHRSPHIHPKALHSGSSREACASACL